MEKVQKVELLLDRITEQNKKELIEEFISYDITSDKQELEEIVTKILEYVCKKPESSYIYAEMCSKKIEKELEASIKCYDWKFKYALIEKLQTVFRGFSGYEGATCVIESEHQPYFMAFCGHSYQNNILYVHIVRNVIFECLKTIIDAKNRSDIDQNSVLSGLIFIYISGSRLDTNRENGTQLLDRCFEKLNNKKSFLTNTNALVFENVVKLRNEKWKRHENPSRYIEWIKKFLETELEVEDDSAHVESDSEIKFEGDQESRKESRMEDLKMKTVEQNDVNTVVFENLDADPRSDQDSETKDGEIQKLRADLEQLRKDTFDEIEELKREIAGMDKKNDENNVVIKNLKLENEKLRTVLDFKTKVNSLNLELTRLAQSYPEFPQILKAKSEICKNIEEGL